MSKHEVTTFFVLLSIVGLLAEETYSPPATARQDHEQGQQTPPGTGYQTKLSSEKVAGQVSLGTVKSGQILPVSEEPVSVGPKKSGTQQGTEQAEAGHGQHKAAGQRQQGPGQNQQGQGQQEVGQNSQRAGQGQLGLGQQGQGHQGTEQQGSGQDPQGAGQGQQEQGQQRSGQNSQEAEQGQPGQGQQRQVQGQQEQGQQGVGQGQQEHGQQRQGQQGVGQQGQAGQGQQRSGQNPQEAGQGQQGQSQQGIGMYPQNSNPQQGCHLPAAANNSHNPLERSPGSNQVTSSTDRKETTAPPIEDFMDNLQSISTENLLDNISSISTENLSASVNMFSPVAVGSRSASQSSSRVNSVLNTSNMVVNDMSSMLTQLAEENKYLNMRN